jgi:hypothetical protein
MSLPPEKKPSLSDLFVSKKLDSPDQEFWDDFQNQVRTKTLSSVVEDGKKSQNNKLIIYSTFSVLLFSLCFWIVTLRNENSVIVAENSKISSFSISKSNADSFSTKSDVDRVSPAAMKQVLKTEQSKELNNGSFVQQSFFASNLETSFQHRTLVSDAEYLDESMAQFTF